MANFVDMPNEVREISHDLLLTISDTYLTPSEREFIVLTLKKRKTKEIAELLDLLPCEVVRRRKIVAKKVRAVYTYHYKLNYVDFLKFACNFLPNHKFKCLFLYYVELKTLKEISELTKTKQPKVMRWLHECDTVLSKYIEKDSKLAPYLNWLADLRHLNIKTIYRSNDERRRLSKIQVGEYTFSEWISKDFAVEP